MAALENGQEQEGNVASETPVRGLVTEQSASPEKVATGSVLSRKLRKLVDSSLETDAETQEALKELSTFFGDNTLKNRRQLRGEIERRSLQINLDFLDSFCEVKDALDKVYEEAKAMNASCLAMQAQLSASKSRTQDLISQTTAMQNQGAILAQKAAQIQQFSEKFQLKPEEEILLRGTSQDFYPISEPTSARKSTDNHISPEFFAALEKAQAIHMECRKLLSGGHLAKQTTALEVLDQMSRLQESGLQQLYRWTQSTVRTAYNLDSRTSSPSTHSPTEKKSKTGTNVALLLPIAMKHLATARPALFRLVLDEFCTARRSLLVKAFLDALTIGGPYGTPKPIELHAHDPLRYVGDMLAWLHQAVPTEADNLKVLLKDIPDDLRVEENISDSCVEDKTSSLKTDLLGKDKLIDHSLGHITEGACRPMRSRVEQILVSESAPVILYKLANLIRFYTSTIQNIIRPQQADENVTPVHSAGLIDALKDLDEMAYKQFISVLQATVNHHTGTDGGLNNRMGLEASNSTDLSPSHSTSALLILLRETLSSTSVMEEQREQLDEIVKTVIDPLLNAIKTTGTAFPTTDQDVYLLNSMYQIHMTLSLFKFNDARLASLESDMQLHLDTLSSEQTSSLIANLGIQPICTMLAQAKSGNIADSGSVNRISASPLPLSKIPEMDNESMSRFMTGFDQFLVAPDAFMLPQIRLLSSSSHRKSVAKRALQVVSATYKQLYEAIVDPFNG